MLNLSFYVNVFLLVLNQFTSVSRDSSFSIYVFDIFTGFFSLYGLFYFLVVKKSFKLPKYSILFLLFTFYAGITLFVSIPRFSQDEILTGFFYLVRLGFYILGALVVFNMVDKKMIKKERVLDAFIFSGVLVAFIGFIQLALLPDFSILDPELGWDPHKNRLASSFFDPNFTGAYLVLCLTLLLERFYPGGWKNKGETPSKKDIIFFFIILLALFFTFSRSAWGMFAVVILFYGIFRSKTLLVAAFLLSFLAYFAIPRIQTRISGITDPADSASLRITSWSNTVKIIRDNFWLGTGFNTFRYVQKEYGFLTPDNLDIHSGAGSDSSILFVMSTTGIIGLIIYLTAFIFPVYDGFVKKWPGWLMVVCMVSGLFLESQFINSLFYPQIMFLFLCIFFIIPSRT